MLEVVFGIGLVLLVTPLVKEVSLPTTPAENAVTVLVTEAAAFEPGRLGRLIVLDFPPDGTDDLDPRAVEPPTERPVDERLMVGSARHHQ